MFRNSELWMFSCQVRNQSVENGNCPLDGDLPAISLYRRTSRSYDSVDSDSSTCIRAPMRISTAARSICRDSFRTLFTRDLATFVDMARFQSASDTRLAIRMPACSALVASLPTFLAAWSGAWLVA